MSQPLRVLFVENSETEAALIETELRRAGFEPSLHRVDRPETYRAALQSGEWDLVIAESSLPRFTGLAALEILHDLGLDLPFIIVSDIIGEDSAVGALGPAIAGELREARMRKERRHTEAALQRASEQIRTLIEDSPLAIFSVGLTGRVESWNHAAEAMFGFTQLEVCGSPVPPILTLGIEAFFDLLQTHQAGEILNCAERTWRHKEGAVVQSEVWTSVLRDASGEVSGVVFTMADITARKRLEEQIRQSHKLDAIGRLAGGIAHDFNNLLTVILGYTQMTLARDSLDAVVRTQLEGVFHAGQQAANLTHQLLAFSRREMIQPKILDLNRIIAGFQGMLRRLIGEHIELHIVAAPGLGSVKADATQMEQIILNLTLNARDAMPCGGRITIETSNIDLGEVYSSRQVGAPPGSYVMLAVCDSGKGMDVETQRQLFEPFFTTKEAGQGTGLGLATVYGAVKQNGGTIWVYSEPGRGSTFKIYLPRVDQSPEVADNDGARAEELAEALKGTETILVVEDEKAVRGLILDALTPQGYRVRAASDGASALAAVENGGPVDLLVTDLVMPGIGGRELVQRLTARCPSMKVLYVSGYNDHSAAGHGDLDPPGAFLQKPFTPHSLTHRIREVLDAVTPLS